MRKALLAIMVMAVAVAALGAEDKSAAEKSFPGKVETVSVFKNGYGFFNMSGTAEAKDGKAVISPVPAAALGTWWFYVAKKGVTIDEAVAAQVDGVSSGIARSIDELVLANVGKEARVKAGDKEYFGTIVAGPERQGPTPPEYGYRPAAGWKPWDVILKTPEGLVSIRRSDVEAISITGGTEVLEEKTKEGQVTLYMRGAADGELPVGCQFLQKGIRWIPSYRIELTDEKNAHLDLQAEVINDIHDLESSRLQLVVGVPNFMWGELLSPLAYVNEMPKLSDFFVSGSGDSGIVAYSSNSIMSQSRFSGVGGSSLIERVPAPGTFTVGQDMGDKGVADLYYYTKDGVTLAAGERASIGVLSAEAEYSNVYKWDVVDGMLTFRDGYDDVYRNWINGNYRNRDNLPPETVAMIDKFTRGDVAEHYIRLINSTDKPLTSGPVLLFSGSDIMAQDLMLYTPAGGDVDIHVTGAPDIRVSQKEDELSRERNKVQYYGRPYDLVKVKCTLAAHNFKKETIRLIVTKEFDGEVEASEGANQVAHDTGELTAVNAHAVVEWGLDVKPDEEVKLELVYSTYVRER